MGLEGSVHDEDSGTAGDWFPRRRRRKLPINAEATGLPGVFFRPVKHFCPATWDDACKAALRVVLDEPKYPLMTYKNRVAAALRKLRHR